VGWLKSKGRVVARWVNSPSKKQWQLAGKWCLRVGTDFLTAVWVFVRVSAFLVTGLVFVFATALLISIIQFQIRIIEAKTQSRTFSLTSLTQQVEMQRLITDSINTIQNWAELASERNNFLDPYQAKIQKVTQDVCQHYPAPEDNVKCQTLLFTALYLAEPAENLDITLALGQAFDELPEPIKSRAKMAIELTNERVKYNEQYRYKLDQLASACELLTSYYDRFAINFARGYLDLPRDKCKLVDARLGRAKLVAISGSPDSSATPGSAAPGPGTPPAAPNYDSATNDLTGALIFDLVAYYRFYEALFNHIHQFSCALYNRNRPICKLTRPDGSAGNAAASRRDFGAEAAASRRDFGAEVVEQIVIAPIDITFVALVIICGALGAMLRITAEMYKPELFGKEVEGQKRTSSVYYFIVGVMCSLIVYILAKTAFAGLADSSFVAKSGNMSPFVTAFLAIVSGLLSDEAFQRIVTAGRATLAQSTSTVDRATLTQSTSTVDVVTLAQSTSDKQDGK
jgi:hypothetical protein